MPGRQPDPLVSLREAARLLGVHHSTLSRAVKRGQLTPAGSTPGGWARFKLSDVSRLKDAGVTGSADVGAPHHTLVESAPPAGVQDGALSGLPDIARRLVGADFAAVTVMDGTGRVSRMYYSGISPEQAEKIGQLPTGRGVLGTLGPEDAPLRLDRITSHPRSVGFPADHPPMESLLGVRVTGEAVRANLYVANGPGRSGFTLRDEELVKALAAYARMALLNEELFARESALRHASEQTEQQLKTVLERTPAAVVVIDAATRKILSANAMTGKILGVRVVPGDAAAPGGLPVRVFTTDGAEVKDEDRPFFRALATGQPTEPIELAVLLPDGGYRPVLLSASPVHGPDGKVTAVVIVFQDLTQIKDTYRQLDAVVRGISAGVVLVNGQTGEVTYASAEARRLTSLGLEPGTPRRVYETGLRYLKPDGSQFKVEDLPLQTAMRERRPVRGVEVVFARPDGRSIPTVVSASPVLDEAGNVISGVAVFQDVTRMKELESVKSDFFSMVTHDLRSPVSTIKGITRTAMSEAEAGSPIATYLDAIDEEADHLTEIVSNFLDMSRIEAGVNIFEFETCHMADLVHDAVRRSGRSRQAAGREITADVPQDLPSLYADPQQIGRVLDNLLSNALKYSAGPVQVRSFQDAQGRVVTEVIDQGDGIPPEHVDSLFSKFFRVRQGQRRGREGAGLGLAICKAVVEAQRGEIGVRSKLREGSTFWFALPAEAGAAGF